jgi:hypothetical protein
MFHCSSGCLHVSARLPLDGFAWNLISLSKNPDLVEIWQKKKYRALYMKAYLLTLWSRVLLEKLTGFAANQGLKASVALIVTDEVTSPLKSPLSMNRHQAIRKTEEVQIFCERAVMLCYTWIACLVLKVGLYIKTRF